MKYFLIISTILIFIITIPFAYQNGGDYKKYHEEIEKGFKTIDKVCDSGCTEYPKDWVQDDNQLEAENYCLRA